MDHLAQTIAKRFLKAQEEPEDKYSAGHLYYCPDDQTVLLTKRSGIMHHPHKWDIPGGRSDKGERSPKTTAAREAKEELGNLPGEPKLVDTHIETWKKDGEDYHYHVFLYAIPEQEKKRWTPKIELDEENSAFKWFKIDELPKKDKLHFDLSWLPDEAKAKTASAKGLRFALEILKPRYEYKYWIALDRAPAIREYIRPHVTADEHGDRYTIRNIYLDNHDLEFFADHVLRPKEAHLKLRVRTYEAGSEVFLEVKRKSGGICSKSRSIVPTNMYSSVVKTASLNADRIPFVKLAIEHRSGPIIRLDYDREAYNAHEAEGRVTIDTNVRYSRHNSYVFQEGVGRQLLPRNAAVLELKFSGEMPVFMKQLIAAFGLKRRSISKYCMSIAQLINAHELVGPPGLI